MAEQIKLCMLDPAGRRQDRPLVRMQSMEGLKHMIRSGDRVAECFGEMKRRNDQVRQMRNVIRKKGGG